jgi:hypothetical protein
MKKPCTACGKQIPGVALDCVFCGARQPAGETVEAIAGTDIAAPASSSRTDDTLVAFRAGDLAGAPGKPLLGMPTGELNAALTTALAEQATSTEPSANGEANANTSINGDANANGNNGSVPAQAKLTGVMQAVQLSPEAVPAPAAPPPATANPAAHAGTEKAKPSDSARAARPAVASSVENRPFSALSRMIMGAGGAVLIAVFFLPWHGVSSWQLLESLGGAEFVRQLFYLTGGIVLVASAVLPVPFGFRAVIGASVAATPVLLGAGGMIEGWRGVVAALAILGLPATQLLRSSAKSSGAARALVVIAVAAVVTLYVAPFNSVVPIVLVTKMIVSAEIGPLVMGIFILIPLVFAALSLLGLMGRDLTDVGVLLAVLSLLWAPVVVALRGLLIDDGTQVYVAVALLWASATAALSLAQLLSLAARDSEA